MGVTNPKLASGNGARPYVLAHSGVASTAHTGTLTETTKGTIKVPGGTLGKNDALRITVVFGKTTAVGTVIYRVKFGGVAIGGMQDTVGTKSVEIIRFVWNRNSLSSQAVRDDIALGVASSTLVTTASVNTAVDQDITFTIQLANAGDSCTVEAYTVEVIPAP